MKKNKIVFSASGGSTKFICLLEGYRQLIQDYKIIPTDMCGVSAGAITSFLSVFAINKPELFDIGIKMGLNITLNQMFEKSPVKENGKLNYLTILWRIIRGENSFGVQNIEHLFKEFINEDEFNKYQKSDLPNVWILAVSPLNMKRGFWNLKDKSINYQKALDIVSASSHIPVFSQPINVDGDFYVDGGVRNHNPSPKFIDLFGEEIKTLYSFYSRLETIDLSEDLNWDKNVLNVLQRILFGMSMEISKRDSQYERLKSKELDFELKQFFYPGNILQSQYDTNKDLLLELYKEAILITKQTMDVC